MLGVSVCAFVVHNVIIHLTYRVWVETAVVKADQQRVCVEIAVGVCRVRTERGCVCVVKRGSVAVVVLLLLCAVRRGRWGHQRGNTHKSVH